jgi:hypothetical protein
MKYKPGDKVFVKIRDEWKPAVYAKHRDSVDLPHGVRFEDGSYYIIYDSEIIDRHKCEKCGVSNQITVLNSSDSSSDAERR